MIDLPVIMLTVRSDVQTTARDALGDLEGSVVALDPRTFGETMVDVRTIAQLTGTERAALDLIARQRARVDAVVEAVADEPLVTVAALEWLEAALSRRDGALLVASHERAFLDAVVTRIWELRDRRLVPFRGGYSQYLVQREQADARQRKDAETQSDQIAKEQELIQKYRSQRKHTKMHEHERRPAPFDGVVRLARSGLWHAHSGL